HPAQRAAVAHAGTTQKEAQAVTCCGKHIAATRDGFYDLKHQGANAPLPGESGRRAAHSFSFSVPTIRGVERRDGAKRVLVRAQGAERTLAIGCVCAVRRSTAAIFGRRSLP